MDNQFLSDNYNKRNENKKKKKFDFNQKKINTIKSINEVECFLNNFYKFSKYFKFYKIIKK